jgi:hypothetical protein
MKTIRSYKPLDLLKLGAAAPNNYVSTAKHDYTSAKATSIDPKLLNRCSRRKLVAKIS